MVMAAGTFREDRSHWVPDEEVLACPMCAKQFGAFRGRHHCRACGRVVCGDCSKSSLRLQGPGSAKERVCDSCVDLRQHHRSAADELDDRNRMEASLKENLAEKLKQANLFEELLNRICSEGGDGTPLDGDGEPASFFPAGSAAAAPAEAELTPVRAAASRLESRARGQWRASASRLSRLKQDSERLQQECDKLETALQTRISTNEGIENNIRIFEQQLRNKDRVLADTEQLQTNQERLLRELEELQRREAASFAMSSASGSFASGLFSGSIAGDQESRGSDWRRRVCCMRPS